MYSSFKYSTEAYEPEIRNSPSIFKAMREGKRVERHFRSHYLQSNQHAHTYKMPRTPHSSGYCTILLHPIQWLPHNWRHLVVWPVQQHLRPRQIHLILPPSSLLLCHGPTHLLRCQPAFPPLSTPHTFPVIIGNQPNRAQAPSTVGVWKPFRTISNSNINM